MQAVHTERRGVHLQRVNRSPVSTFDQRREEKVVVLKRSGRFVLMQGFASSVRTAFCKQRRSEPRSNKHFEGFLWVGFWRSCSIKTFSDNWVNISSFLSQRCLEERSFYFPFFKKSIMRKQLSIQLMRIQHKDSDTNRLISGALPKEEWCVCVRVCVCQSFTCVCLSASGRK